MLEEGVENMRIIIVDDRPFLMWDTIQKLKGMEVDTIVMLYFHGPLTYRAEKDSAVKQKCGELGIKLIQIESRLDFRNQLDEYYSDKDTLLFIDYNLGESEDFENKIDIICAKEKMQQKNDFRIWFYTASSMQMVDRLNRIFDGHTIPVVEFIPQEYVLKLDYDYIQDKILNGRL